MKNNIEETQLEINKDTLFMIKKLREHIEKLEKQVKELKEKHIFMEKAIKKKAGMLEPIRKEAWEFKK